jgi:hypothetical protein
LLCKWLIVRFNRPPFSAEPNGAIAAAGEAVSIDPSCSWCLATGLSMSEGSMREIGDACDCLVDGSDQLAELKLRYALRVCA